MPDKTRHLGFAIVGAAVILTAALVFFAMRLDAPDYELTPGPGVFVWKVDRRSGDLWLCSVRDGCTEVTETITMEEVVRGRDGQR